MKGCTKRVAFDSYSTEIATFKPRNHVRRAHTVGERRSGESGKRGAAELTDVGGAAALAVPIVDRTRVSPRVTTSISYLPSRLHDKERYKRKQRRNNRH